MSETLNRRQFLERIQLTIARWSPILGLLGFRIRDHVYQASTGPYTVRWIEWCGKAVGWITESGAIKWLR